MPFTSAAPTPAAWRGRRVLITGHTGFKGSWLCARLLRLGARVSGVALPPEGARAIWRESGLQREVDSAYADLRDAEAAARAVAAAKPEIVLHLAAQPLVRRGYREPVLTYATNVMGTVHVLDAVRQTPAVACVVVVTSDKVYADEPVAGGYDESARLGGADPYSGSKAAAELVVETYRTSYFAAAGTPALGSARAGNVIGGGDFSEDRLLPDAFRAREADVPLVVRHPEAIRPWQHVLDPLNGYLLLAEALQRDPAFATAWNFGPDEPGVAVREVLAHFARGWGDADGRGTRDEPSPEHESARLEIDASRSRTRLGWSSVWDTARAVTATAAWYRDYLHGAPVDELIARDIAAFDATPVARSAPE
jgi:CDP-glucose 4,6-dehydratase